jgi:hypothetical protein
MAIIKNVLHMTQFSLFIPVYNEEKIIEKNLSKIFNKLNELNLDYEIIVADDGSTDSTGRIVKELRKKYENLRLYRSEKNLGRGEILSVSFKTANGKYIGFMDIDLATDLNYIKDLIENLKNADVVTGSRWLKESLVKREFFRWMISFFYNKFLLKVLFNSRVKDHQCGFKGFKKEVALKLVKECGVRKDRRWAWDTEMLIRAQRHGYNIKEFPVEWDTGRESKFKFLRDIAIVWTYLFKLRLKLLKEDLIYLK